MTDDKTIILPPVTTQKGDVLVAIPIFKGHEKWVENFLEFHKDYDVMFVENTYNDNILYDKLVEMKDSGKYPNLVHVEKHTWNPDDEYILSMLSKCYDKCRAYMVEHDYKWWLWTAADIYVENGGSVNELLQWMKWGTDNGNPCHALGYPTNMYSLDGPMSVYKSGDVIWDEKIKNCRLDIFTNEDFAEHKDIMKDDDNPDIPFKVHGCVGFTILSHELCSKAKFRYPKGNFKFGEDMFFLNDIERIGYECYCDISHEATNYTKPDDYVNDIKQSYEDKHPTVIQPVEKTGESMSIQEAYK